MSRIFSIPPKLHPEVVAQVDCGSRYQDVVDWCMREHGIKTSKPAVMRIVNRAREERAQITRAVIISKTVPIVAGDLDRLEELRRILAERMKRAVKANKDELIIRLAEQERKLIESRLTLAGAHKDAPEETNETIATITAQIVGPRPLPIGGDSPPNE